MKKTALASILLGLALSAITARADENCVDFKWDVAQERSLFAGSADQLAAGMDAKSAPMMLLNHLYALKLSPQDNVAFAVAPGKKVPAPGSNAGIVSFKLPAGGSYRVAIDMPFWIDVVSNGALVEAKDFQGQRGCSAPHKILVYDLLGTRPFFLQLSNAKPDSVRVTITATPVRKL
jgi:hypothetical protein